LLNPSGAAGVVRWEEWGDATCDVLAVWKGDLKVRVGEVWALWPDGEYVPWAGGGLHGLEWSIWATTLN
jgi:hypothetical protein